MDYRTQQQQQQQTTSSPPSPPPPSSPRRNVRSLGESTQDQSRISPRHSYSTNSFNTGGVEGGTVGRPLARKMTTPTSSTPPTPPPDPRLTQPRSKTPVQTRTTGGGVGGPPSLSTPPRLSSTSTSTTTSLSTTTPPRTPSPISSSQSLSKVIPPPVLLSGGVGGGIGGTHTFHQTITPPSIKKQHHIIVVKSDASPQTLNNSGGQGLLQLPGEEKMSQSAAGNPHRSRSKSDSDAFNTSSTGDKGGDTQKTIKKLPDIEETTVLQTSSGTEVKRSSLGDPSSFPAYEKRSTKEDKIVRGTAMTINISRTETAGIMAKALSTLDTKVATIDYKGLKEKVSTEEEFNRVFGHPDVEFTVPNSNHRDKIATEILSTEATYVKALQVCIMVYLDPFEKWLSQSKKQNPVILKFIQFFHHVLFIHTIFLNNLRMRFRDWSDSQQIGDLTRTMIPLLSSYKFYAEDYDKVLKQLDLMKKASNTYKNILKDGEIHPLTKTNSLESFLILPIQRLPRYVLLLTELIKSTTEGHPDYVSIQKSLAAMKKTTEEINIAIVDCERRAKCLEIQKYFVRFPLVLNQKQIDLVEAHRYYVGEMTMDVLNTTTKKQEQQRLILFNDLLICASPAGQDTLRHTFIFLLENTTVKENDDVSFTISSPPTKLTISVSSSSSSSSSSPQEKEKKSQWMKLLDSTIASSKENQKSRNQV